MNFRKYFFLTLLFQCIIFNIAHSKVTFQEILKNPSDIKLNLQYAKEQEQEGKYKNTIASLERLNMLYPVNTDIKLYLLSVLLKMDSLSKIELMANAMLQDPNTTKEARDYIEQILKNINDQKDKPKSKWFAYADLGFTQNEHSNIEGMSKTGFMQQNDPSSGQDKQIKFSSDTIMYDKAFSRSGSITLGKNIDKTSAFSVTAGITSNTQNKGKGTGENDLGSASISYSKIIGQHYILPYAYYSKPNYRNNLDDSITRGFGFSNNYIFDKNHSTTYGFSYAKTGYDLVARNLDEDPGKKNNETYTGSLGYSYAFSDVNLINSKISFTNKNAVANYNSYDGLGFDVNYTRAFSFGNLKLGRNFYKNIYDEKNDFFSKQTNRTDKNKISTAQLTGKIKQLLPFMEKLDPKGRIYYNLKHTKTDTYSTMTNYSAIRKNTIFNIIKRFSLYE
mgnify:CR=1 FL=1